MISPDDDSYKATKLIKQGNASVQPPLNKLADFIQREFGVEVLNVIFENATDLRPCRLEVVTETRNDEQPFRCSSGTGWWEKDKVKEEAIINQFLRLMQSKIESYPRLFVIYSAFEQVALHEVYSMVTNQHRSLLVEDIDNPELWHIDSFFSSVTFFFYDEAQKKRYSSSDEIARYSQRYFELLKAHDEFGYLSEDNFRVAIDSKENFEKNYNGNWYYYYK